MEPQATEVREVLDRFEEQNWNRHTANSFESIEGFAKEVVEQGTFSPNAKVDMGLDLTLRERLTGTRRQDVTAMLLIGMILGSALERDVPMDSEAEEQWREGQFQLPK